MPALPSSKAPPIKTKSEKPKVETAPPRVIPTEEAERRIIYPEVKVWILIGDKALTDAQAKELIGWEDEFDYQARMKAEKPSLKKAADFGEDYTLKDVNGRKVRLWNNQKNRPFDETRARVYAQDILRGNWRLNLENIIVSKYGNVISGQHRLCGFILACQLWAGKDKAVWQQYWKVRPTIETLIAIGGSEDDDVLRTIDNVKPRTLTDVFFTSPLYGDLDHAGRKEASRMLDYGVDLLWKRTELVKSATANIKYQTHSSSVEFADNHPRLQNECVRTMYDLNKDRVLSNLKLSPGQSAAMLYLMGSSNTDPDAGYLDERKESALNWDNWEKALAYWQAIGSGPDGDKAVEPVRKALADLVETESGGRLTEKLAILVKGWLKWVNDEEITEEDLALEYVTDKNQNRVLGEVPLCGGIDFGGFKAGEEEKVPTEEEIEAAKAEERKKAAEKTTAKVAKKEMVKNATKPGGELLSEEDKKVIAQRNAAAAKPVKRPPVAMKVK